MNQSIVSRTAHRPLKISFAFIAKAFDMALHFARRENPWISKNAYLGSQLTLHLQKKQMMEFVLNIQLLIVPDIRLDPHFLKFLL